MSIIIDFYISCIENIKDFTIDDVPEQRRVEIEQIIGGADNGET